MTTSPRRMAACAITTVCLFVSGCGDDDDGDDAAEQTTTTASADGSSEQSTEATTPGLDPQFVELFQTQLNAVGCFAGGVDGVDGPETTAAVIAFQTAKGLSEDGVVGNETEGALEAAVEAGETVCTGAGATQSGGSTGGSTVNVTSAGFENSFTVRSCDNPDESTLDLTAENAASITLSIDATDGTGTMEVGGGTEEDGVELSGSVTSVTVGDTGDFTVEGTFSDGEAFTITGSCERA